MGGKGKGDGKGKADLAKGKGKGEVSPAKGKGKAPPAKGKGKAAPPAKGKGKGKGGKPEPSDGVPEIPIGTEVTAQFSDGEWYKAHVVEWSKKKGQVKVRFAGYTAADDAWVTADQLRSKYLKGGVYTGPGSDLPAVGSTCLAQIEPGGKFTKAEIIEVSPQTHLPVKVRIEVTLPVMALKNVQKGAAKGKAAPKAEASPAIKGMEVEAQFADGKFYKAVIVKKRKGAKPYLVHYIGHGDECDTWVSMEEIRSKALKAAVEGAAAPEPKGKGKGKGTGKDAPEKGKGKGKGKPEPEAVKGKGKGTKGKGKGKEETKGKGKETKGKGKEAKGKGKEAKGKGKETKGKDEGKGKGKGKSKGKGKGK